MGSIVTGVLKITPFDPNLSRSKHISYLTILHFHQTSTMGGCDCGSNCSLRCPELHLQQQLRLQGLRKVNRSTRMSFMESALIPTIFASKNCVRREIYMSIKCKSIDVCPSALVGVIWIQIEPQ